MQNWSRVSDNGKKLKSLFNLLNTIHLDMPELVLKPLPGAIKVVKQNLDDDPFGYISQLSSYVYAGIRSQPSSSSCAMASPNNNGYLRDDRNLLPRPQPLMQRGLKRSDRWRGKVLRKRAGQVSRGCHNLMHFKEDAP